MMATLAAAAVVIVLGIFLVLALMKTTKAQGEAEAHVEQGEEALEATERAADQRARVGTIAGLAARLRARRNRPSS